jgi:hypothetical protein
MVSDIEQTTPDPFLNPMGFLQDYLISWIEAGTQFCDTTIRTSEYCLKTLWAPWFKATGVE